MSGRGEERRIGKRGEQKRKHEKDYEMRMQQPCPYRCGNWMSRGAHTCKECRRTR